MPLFLIAELFFDCAWQFAEQFPDSFQFNQRLLLFAMQNVHSQRFGDFLLPQPSLRGWYEERTPSLWRFAAGRKEFQSVVFDDQSIRVDDVAALTPRIWTAAYFSYQLAGEAAYARKLVLARSTAAVLSLNGKNLLLCPPLDEAAASDQVNLSNNRFTFFPDNLFCLGNTRSLSLQQIGLKTLPARILFLLGLHLPHLELVDLSGNLLTTLPSTIASLTSLKTLLVKTNSLASLPIELSRLSLEKLDLSKNDLPFNGRSPSDS